MKKLFKASTILALLSPLMVLGTAGYEGITPVGRPDITDVPLPGEDADKITRLLQLVSYWMVIIATIIIAIGLITFLWGVVQYITAGADEEKRGAARNMMLYGIIALFVMVAVWGLVYFLGSLVGITPGGGVDLPGVPAVLPGAGGPGA